MHRLWKNNFVRRVKPRPGEQILDMAGGTGDIAFRLAREGASVTVADINPAMLEVNGLADFGVKIEPIRDGGKMRGLVTGFRVSWWRKNEDQLKSAYTEIKRSKVGRISRLRGEDTRVVKLTLPELH